MTQLDRSHGTATTGAPRGRSRRPRRLLVGLAALASALALVAAGPTGTAVGDENGKDKDADIEGCECWRRRRLRYTPTSRTTFNNPQSASTASQRKIIDELNRMIDGTAGGETIRIAAYLFDCTTTADALVAAHKRGVKVQLLIDDGERRAATGPRSATRSALTGPSQLRDEPATNGCHTTVTVDHPLEDLPLLQGGRRELGLDGGLGEPVVPQRLQQLEQHADDRRQQDDLRLAEPGTSTRCWRTTTAANAYTDDDQRPTTSSTSSPRPPATR